MRLRIVPRAWSASQALRASASLAAGLGALAASAPADAENWHWGGSASLTGTYTSNANYSPSNLAEGDFVTTVSAGLTVDGEGARLKVHGSLSASALLYATETQNNSIAPQVNIGGTLEAVENFFWIDANAYVTQTFASPFGPQPGNLVNATQNRYTSQNYTLSPYIKGVVPDSRISYQLRDDNYWSYASSFGD